MPVQHGTGAGEQISVTQTVPIVGAGGSQFWMITGSGKWVPSGDALIPASVSIQGAGAPSPSGCGTIKVWTNTAPNHCTFPTLFFTTALGSGNATVTIQGTSGSAEWDANDTFQIVVVELDHTGIGGGA